MTFFQFYALFGAPLLLLLVGLAVRMADRPSGCAQKSGTGSITAPPNSDYAARMRGRSSRSMVGISLSGFGRLNR